MRIELTNVFVDDLDKALDFYTNVLGFQKKLDIPLGPDTRWLTVVSPEAPDGVQLLLEPAIGGHPIAKTYQSALFDAGIPYASFGVDDIYAEYERIKGHGVLFRMPPTPLEGAGVINALFEDGCGNLINLHQLTAPDTQGEQ